MIVCRPVAKCRAMAAIVVPLSILGSTPAGGDNDTPSDILEPHFYPEVRRRL